MWNYIDYTSLIENAILRRHYKDGMHKHTQLIAKEKYALHNKNDIGYTDESENFIPPVYSYQYTTSADNEKSLFDDFEVVEIKQNMEII